MHCKISGGSILISIRIKWIKRNSLSAPEANLTDQEFPVILMHQISYRYLFVGSIKIRFKISHVFADHLISYSMNIFYHYILKAFNENLLFNVTFPQLLQLYILTENILTFFLK